MMASCTITFHPFAQGTFTNGEVVGCRDDYGLSGLLESQCSNRAQDGRFATILKSLRTVSETTRTAMINSNRRKNMLVWDARHGGTRLVPRLCS